ncbi:MAG: alcohol dehydrogenase catalytic domain-containing protein [archaeon]|nr:alcohol dehydrogenase catalytic domain-containing protein [archaeon]
MSNPIIRAAFVGDKGSVVLRTVERPSLDKGSIMVEMKSSGICGTDLDKLTGGYTASTVLGHEVAGTVTETATGEFEVGQDVVPHHHVACGECYFCRNGAETMCEGFRTSNFIPCGFADEFNVPEYNVSRGGVHKFQKISYLEASFAEPLGCCIRGLEKALHSNLTQSSIVKRSTNEISFTQAVRNALVVGAGPIGLLHMDILGSQFPDLNLVSVDVSDTRLEFAEKFENAKPISPSKTSGDFAEEAKKLVEGRGYDLVIVATGNASAFAQAIRCVRKSGSLLLFGAAHKGATYTLDLQSMLLSELTMTSSYATTEREIEQAISLLETHKINVKKFITSQFPLENIEDAMRTAREEGQVKVLVTA